MGVGHIFRRDHHVQMNMIGFNANFLHKPVRMKSPYFLQLHSKIRCHSLHQDFSSVSGNPDNMILRFIDGVGSFLKLRGCPVYRRTANLALIPALPDGEFSLN